MPEEEDTLAPPVVQPKRTEFELYKVVRKDITKSLKVTGNFQSSKEQELFVSQSGRRLKTICVTEMQDVKKGELLAKIDSGDVEIRMKLQEKTVQKMQLQLDNQKKNYDQYKSLPTDAQPSLKEMESMKLNIDATQIDLDSAKISLEDLRKKYQESMIQAPFDGIVTYIADLKAGDILEAYKTIITVSDPNNLQIYYKPADASTLEDIREGMPVMVTYNGNEYQGEVSLSPHNIPKDATEKQKDSLLINVKEIDGKTGDSVEFVIDIQKKNNVIVYQLKHLRTIWVQKQFK
jgi:RND family efflux transporter MFP subunit